MTGSFLRLDFAGMRDPRVTSQGFLRLDAQLGRCGVLRYTQPDGSVRRELRLPEEVFAADAMASLEGAPLTYKHPPRSDAWINRQTWREHQIGFVGDTITRLDGDFVGGTVTVQDELRVNEVATGKLRELSPGYTCREMEMKPGVHATYGAYDAIQRGIIHNHVGLGPQGWGRQGRDVAVHLDAADDDDVGILRLDQSALGDFLRARILESGMTVLEVAKSARIIDPIQGDPLKFTGATQPTWILESILDGWTPRPTDEQLEALARVLGLRMDALLALLPTSDAPSGGRHLPGARQDARDDIDPDRVRAERLKREQDRWRSR